MRRTALGGLLVALAAAPALAGGVPVSDDSAGAARGEAFHEFSVLTYNTHGLPAWIARDDPERRLPLLLERTAAYDLVLLQEDFAYHELVREHAPHPVVVRGNGPRTGWLGLSGSGLTVLARAASPRVRRARPYGLCNGWLAAANDCLGNKGFLMLRLRLAEGVEIDVWNTHLDAGWGDGDHAVRAAQLEILGDSIARESRGRALIAGGDFNTDWNDPRERALLRSFARRIGADIAVSAPHGRWPGRLDYLLMRSGSRVKLDRLDGGVAPEFVDAAGADLSDHPALWARLRATAR